jgi:hypothetical protein
MAREDLVPLNRRTKDEQKEIAKKGGIASGVARRKKRSMREVLKMLKDMPVKDRKIIAQLQAAGIDDKDMTIGAAMAFSAIIHAMKGNGQMMKLVLDVMGETSDARLREREVKLREKAFKDERGDTIAPITFVFEREETE